MRIFIAAMLIAFSTACVCAQGIGKGGGNKSGKSEAELAEEKKNRKIDEKAYNDAISRIPDKPVQKPDPWGTVR
jgi:hypothetical protein